MKNLLIYGFLLFVSLGYAQKKFNKANTYFADMDYIAAIKEYEKVTDKETAPPEVITNVADSYYFINDFTNAAKWYDLLYKKSNEDMTTLYVIRYTQSLRAMRDYDKADDVMKNHLKKRGDQEQIRRFVNQKKHLDSLLQTQSKYTVKNAGINTRNSDFGPTYYGNQLVFSSSRDSVNGKLYSYNKQPYLNFYVGDLDKKEGTVANIKKFFPELVSQYHDATLCFTRDQETVFYTTNTRKGTRKLLNGKNDINNFQLVRGEIKEGKIVNQKPLHFNSLDYSVGHPCLSDDEKWLFFVSDMSGGEGETDIYMVALFEDGSIGNPRNLGKTINTRGREMFPFYADGVLYFASEGHYGLGGLDIFMSKHLGDYEFSEPKNLGRPVNSSMDDFSYIYDPEKRNGFFASNRLGGAGDDDIYFFTKAPDEYPQTVSGKVLNAKGEAPIPGADVIVTNLFDEEIARTTSDAYGRYEIVLPPNSQLKIEGSKKDFSKETLSITTANEPEGEIQDADLRLTRYEDLVKKDGDHEKIDINPIYFEFNKHIITKESEAELDKVIYAMQKFPNLKIRIESHTDSRGSDAYNMKLSTLRAESTYTYLINNGVDPSRILSVKGFGESMLKNHCKDGVKCSDEEHFENRRSDFIVVGK